MAKFTYLLGAGASAKALPDVEEIPPAIGYVIEQLGPYPHMTDMNGNRVRSLNLQGGVDIFDAVINLEWLRDNCAKEQSIDTLMKILHLTDNHSGDAGFVVFVYSFVCFVVKFLITKAQRFFAEVWRDGVCEMDFHEKSRGGCCGFLLCVSCE